MFPNSHKSFISNVWIFIQIVFERQITYIVAYRLNDMEINLVEQENQTIRTCVLGILNINNVLH